MELDCFMLRRPTDPAPVLVRRFVQLFVGLFLYGMGIALIVRGELGVAPWDVLTQGIAKQTGLNFGLITVITSGIVLLLWIPIRQKPGFGTVMNALLVGPAADLGLWLIPPGLDLWVRMHRTQAPVALPLTEPVRSTPSTTDSSRTASSTGEPALIAMTSVPRSSGRSTVRESSSIVPGRRSSFLVSSTSGERGSGRFMAPAHD